MTDLQKSKLIKQWHKLSNKNLGLRELIESRKEKLNNPITRNIINFQTLVRLMKKDIKQQEKLNKLANKINGFTF